jgi:prevent-host-death family protein
MIATTSCVPERLSVIDTASPSLTWRYGWPRPVSGVSGSHPMYMLLYTFGMRPEVMSVSEFRASLATALERVQDPDGDPVFVGSHRKPEAVVMSVSQYEHLIEAASWRDAAEDALASVRAEGLEPSREGRAAVEDVAAGRLREEQAIARLLQRHRR